MSRSINDLLLEETHRAAAGGLSTLKAAYGLGSGTLPYQGYGGGYGGAQMIYGSEHAWDAAMDMIWGQDPASRVNWAQRAGDPSTSSLMMALYRFLASVLPEAPLQVRVRKSGDKGGKSGSKGESVTVDDHPLPQLWNQPNEAYSGSTLRKGIAFGWATRSEAYLLKFFNDADEPIELWWEPNWSIRPVWDTEGHKFISHYEVNRNGTWYPVPTRQVVHLRDGLHPGNQRVGLDTTASILPELAGDKEAAYYYANLMGGSGVPPFIASIDAGINMSPQEVMAFQQHLENRTTGANKGKPIVAKGATITKLAQTPREMDLRDTRYMPEERFCAVKGCPAVVLELGSGLAHSIYNNVQQAERRAWYSYVIPLLRHTEEELVTQLLVDFEELDLNNHIKSGNYLKHDTTEVAALQEDADSKATRIATLWEKGLIRRDRGLSQLGYDPTDPANPKLDEVFFYEATASPTPPPGMGGEEEEGAEDAPGGGAVLPFGRKPKQLPPARAEEEEDTAKSITRRLASARRRRLLGTGKVEL